MASYKLSLEAEYDLIRIYQFGVENFGHTQAEKYFNTFFEYFEIIADNPYSFESVDFIKHGYRSCVCGTDTIFFRIINNEVEIMTIVGKQDMQKLL